ncbi:MAG: glycosyltransferase, partial [Paraglaciecola sp.]|nr:glycosyltransferase [Paraglaciecola sp.]
MPNIAFVHSVNVLGGAERMSEAIIAGLQDKGYHFSLISPEPGALSETFAKYGAKNYFCPLFQPAIKHPILTWQHQRRCTELLTSAKIDVLHTGDLLCVRSFSRAASNGNIPLVCHVHFPVEAPFVAWVFNKMPAPAAFVFCSQELQNSSGPILAKYCPNTAQYVFHNGVNIDYFAPAPEFGQTTDMASLKHIGIVANLQFRKGHDDFIQMAKEVLKTHQNVHFDVIGGDILQEPREGILRQQIADLGIEQHFTFHGQLADVRDAIRKLDIYV